VPTEVPRGRKLAELVSNHVFADEDRDMTAAIMDGNRQTNHIRNHG
jgi:hypothetical protein